eukprot:5222309-Pleurochrysis_carterae.AAC.1
MQEGLLEHAERLAKEETSARMAAVISLSKRTLLPVTYTVIYSKRMASIRALVNGCVHASTYESGAASITHLLILAPSLSLTPVLSVLRGVASSQCRIACLAAARLHATSGRKPAAVCHVPAV